MGIIVCIMFGYYLSKKKNQPDRSTDHELVEDPRKVIISITLFSAYKNSATDVLCTITEA